MNKVFSAVKAIIKKDNKFLVSKKIFLEKEVWDLPGGKVEYKENPYETLIREIKEEVFLDIKIVESLGLFWFFRDDGDQVVCSTFFCEVDNYNVDLSKNPVAENIVEYKWVSKEEFLDNEYQVGNESLKELIFKSFK